MESLMNISEKVKIFFERVTSENAELSNKDAIILSLLFLSIGSIISWLFYLLFDSLAIALPFIGLVILVMGGIIVSKTIEIMTKTSSFNKKTSSKKKNMIYFETKPPFMGKAYCSDEKCNCNEVELSTSDSYIYISQELVEFRRDCLTNKKFDKKVDQIKKDNELENFTFIGGIAPTPIIMCKNAAVRNRLDLGKANSDAKLWWLENKLPLETTPIKQ